MQSKWRQVRLGDLIEVKHGWPFKSELFFEQKTGKGIVVAVGNFRYTGGFRFDETATKEYRGEYPSDYNLKPNEILLIMTCQTAGGEILGIPARVPDDGQLYLHNQRLGKVILKRPDDLLPDFLYWLCLSPSFNRSLVSTASGTKILHTSPSRICDFKFALPPICVQQEIAATLWSLENRIDLLRQTNATLEAIAQALFKSWFIDFDPVHAKAEGREPECMDAATASLFPDVCEESALGKIPKGWRIGVVEDILVLQRGFDLPASKRTRGHFSVLAASGPSGSHNESMVAGPGVTTGRSGVIGNVYFVHEDFWPLNTSLWVKEFKVATPVYAYQFLKTLDLKRLNAGSAVPTLNRNHVHAQPAILPSQAIVDAYTALVSPLLARVRANEQQASALTELRDALLPRLISGKFRLTEAEDQLNEAIA